MKQERIPISKPYLTSIEEKYLLEAFRSGWISSIGACIREFESSIARLSGTAHGIAVSNGTTGLHLAMKALGIGPGDEVIVPALSFVASANTVVHCGARPVFVDISADTLCIDPKAILSAITPKTRAIMPVHLYGCPAPMDEINAIAREKKIYVVEDAAEGLGAHYKGKMVGSLADCAVFSFFGNKIITTGEGGLITTDSSAIADRAAHLRDHAMVKTRRYWHDEIGFNYRMTNLQAAVGLGQLQNLESILTRRRELLKRYADNLSGLSALRMNREPAGVQISPWFVCVDSELLADGKRDRVMAELDSFGIDSRPYFYPMTQLPMYQSKQSFPVADALSATGLNLPLFPDLQNDQVDYICDTFKKVYNRVI